MPAKYPAPIMAPRRGGVEPSIRGKCKVQPSIPASFLAQSPAHEAVFKPTVFVIFVRGSSAGLHILIDSGLAKPRDNREIIQLLGEKGVLPAQESHKRLKIVEAVPQVFVDDPGVHFEIPVDQDVSKACRVEH